MMRQDMKLSFPRRWIQETVPLTITTKHIEDLSKQKSTRRKISMQSTQKYYQEVCREEVIKKVEDPKAAWTVWTAWAV